MRAGLEQLRLVITVLFIGSDLNDLNIGTYETLIKGFN